MSQVTFQVDGAAQPTVFGAYFTIDDAGNLIILDSDGHTPREIGAVAAGKWDWVQVNGLGS